MNWVRDDSNKGTELALPAEMVPPGLLSAIFDSLSTPYETVERSKHGGFILSQSNIEDLYYRIDQIVSDYTIRELRCDFVISVEEGGVYRFSSIEKLKSANLSVFAKNVTGVGIKFDILIGQSAKVDSEEDIKPQRFKVQISLEDPLRILEKKGEYSYLGFRLRQPEIEAANIRIDFSNYAVSRTIFSVVDEWLDGLKTDNIDTISDDCRKFISNASSYFSGILPIVAILGGIIFEPHKYDNIFSPVRYILSVILAAGIMIYIGTVAEERVSKILRNLTPRTGFLISSGDIKKSEEVARIRKKSKSRLYIIFVGIFLASLVGIGVNLVSSLFV